MSGPSISAHDFGKSMAGFFVLGGLDVAEAIGHMLSELQGMVEQGSITQAQLDELVVKIENRTKHI